AGYARGGGMLAMGVVEVVWVVDGAHDIAEIQQAVQRQRGEQVEAARIEELARALDQHGFLEGSAFEARRADIDGAFLAAPSRAASHAGGAYPTDAGALAAMIDGFFTRPHGPGAIDRA